jgi:hypothetical protein
VPDGGVPFGEFPVGTLRFVNTSHQISELQFMKHLPDFCVCINGERMMLFKLKSTTMTDSNKRSPVIEDLREHSAQQLRELRMLLDAGMPGRPDPRRPGFFELDGVANIYYVFRYPAGHKVLLLAAWQKDTDPVAEMVAYTCPAA